MARSSPPCATYQQKVTARGKQGLVCSGCDQARHFECINITEERKQAILSGAECYLCSKCKSKQRLSLSFVASLPAAPKPDKKATVSASANSNATSKTSTSSKVAVAPVTTLSDPNEGKLLVSKLLEEVNSLKNLVKALEDKLSVALSRPANPTSSVNKVKPNSAVTNVKHFSLNGVAAEDLEDNKALRDKVSHIVKSLDDKFELETSTTIKRLPAKPGGKSNTILISVILAARTFRSSITSRKGRSQLLVLV